MRLIAEGNPTLGRIPTDRGVVLESSPLLGRARNLYQDFTFRAEYAYDYGMPQWLAKSDHVFARVHLERLFLGRHKFHHFRVWYRDELSEYVKKRVARPAEPFPTVPAEKKGGANRERAHRAVVGITRLNCTTY